MKSMFRTLLLIIAANCAVASTFAQGNIIPTVDTTKKTAPATVRHIKPKGPKAIKHEVSVGYRLNTDGWSFYTDIGRVKAVDAKRPDMFNKVRFWQVEFSEKKGAKQEKIMSETNNAGSSPNNYYYGKINNFYGLKLGYGFRKLIAGKPDPGCVSIHWVNTGGFSLGLLKPYYLNVKSDHDAIKYSEATQANFLNQRIIEGAAGFSKGLDEIKPIPGIHLKSALHFDFSVNRKNAIAVETGVNFEYYSSEIAIMALQPTSPYFLDAFLAFQIGRRW